MKGIMFRPWKIAAIAAKPEKEWQTRRAMKPQPHCTCESPDWHGQVIDWIGYKHEGKTAYFCYKCGAGLRLIDEWSGHGMLPRYHVGEVAYIKEALVRKRNAPPMPCDYITYALDFNPVSSLNPNEKYPKFGRPTWIWKRDRISPMFMPAWAARYFIKILDVQACRTRDISFEDCLAEGVVDSPQWQELSHGSNYKPPEPLNPADLSNEEADKEIDRGWIEYARQAYFALYDSINGKGAHERNYDWKYTFKLVPAALEQTEGER